MMLRLKIFLALVWRADFVDGSRISIKTARAVAKISTE